MAEDTARMVMTKYKSDNFYQVYGMTESGPTGTVLMPYEQVAKAGSIGSKALPGADLVVMKDDGNQAQRSEVGEIWLQADSMMKGYFKNQEATAEAFHGDWYKTGDMARIDKDGYLYIVDRTKDMIVTGGENVYSKEVEDVLVSCPDIVEAAVIGVPNPEWGETVAAVVVPAKDKKVDADFIKGYLSDKLAKYKIPRVFHIVDALPHTPTGKVMKYQLRDQYK